MAVPVLLTAAVSWILSAGTSGVLGNRADASLVRLARGPDPDLVDRIARLASGAADVRVDRAAFSEWLGDQRTFDLVSRLAGRPEAAGDAGLYELAGDYASELLATADEFGIIADGQSADAQTKAAELIACTLLALWTESDPVQRPLFILLGDTTALRQGQEQLRDLVEKLITTVTISNSRVDTVRSGPAGSETRPNYRDEMDALLSRLERIDDGIQNLLVQLDTAHTLAVVSGAMQLPASTAGFTGRADELTALVRLLDPAGPAVVSAVAGMAGVGKTSLAVEAAHAARRRGWFKGGVLFIDLHGYGERVESERALDALLRALEVPGSDIPTGAEERAGLYRSVLAQKTDPILVIADNASSEAQVRLLLPGTGPHKLLVTSRYTLAGLGARLVDVAVLDEESAVDLLDAALRVAHPNDDRISDDQQAAKRLARICGGLPLALQITAALMKADPTLSAAELADELALESEQLAQLAYDDGSGGEGHSVAAAFELSYHRLPDPAARVFRLLPVNPGADMSTQAVAVLADLPVGQGRRVLSHLTRAHLVEAAPGTAHRWRMHDLVLLYARRLSDSYADSDGREQARDRLLEYYLNTAEAADSHLGAAPRAGISRTFSSRDDALAWLDEERTCLVSAVQMAVGTGQDRVAMRLPRALAVYLVDWRQRFDEALSTAITSREIARRIGDLAEEAAALNRLGIVLRELRRFEEAFIACRESAAIYKDIGNRKGESAALNNLGTALCEARRFEEAIVAHQESVVICRDIGYRYGAGMALGNLANDLEEVGRFEEAITAHQESAEIFRDVGYRRGEGLALLNLGSTLNSIGQLKEAITACQEAAAICRDIADRRSEGMALHNLGVSLAGLQRYEEAISAYEQDIAICQETGDRHGEGITLDNLGIARQGLRQYEEAITAHQDAAAAYRETSDRLGEGEALGHLGVALRGAQRIEEAITALEDAITIFHETGDPEMERIALDELRATEGIQNTQPGQ